MDFSYYFGIFQASLSRWWTYPYTARALLPTPLDHPYKLTKASLPHKAIELQDLVMIADNFYNRIVINHA